MGATLASRRYCHRGNLEPPGSNRRSNKNNSSDEDNAPGATSSRAGVGTLQALEYRTVLLWSLIMQCLWLQCSWGSGASACFWTTLKAAPAGQGAGHRWLNRAVAEVAAGSPQWKWQKSEIKMQNMTRVSVLMSQRIEDVAWDLVVVQHSLPRGRFEASCFIINFILWASTRP